MAEISFTEKAEILLSQHKGHLTVAVAGCDDYYVKRVMEQFDKGASAFIDGCRVHDQGMRTKGHRQIAMSYDMANKLIFKGTL